MAMITAMAMAARQADAGRIQPASRRVPRRSLREWSVRGALALAILVLGYLSTSRTLAIALLETDAERAYALSPADGRVSGELAEQIATREASAPSGASAARRARADRLAREALRAEPLAPSALTALGLNSQLRGDGEGARRLFAHSDAISRRELGTRLWLIEDAVARGDIPAALSHYDIALRTARSAPDLLFPVLSAAIADPAIAEALARLMAKQPPWGEQFIVYLGDASTSPVTNARFFRRLDALGLPVPDVAQAGVINMLVNAGRMDDAWAHYRSVRKTVDRRRSRDIEFAAKLPFPSVLDWTPVIADPGVNASIDGGVLDFSVPATIGSIVLQQVQFLPAGRYRLDGVSAGIDAADGAHPYWELVCLDGRALGRVELPNSDQDSGRFSGQLTVGADCKAQALRLVIRPSQTISGMTGQIERVRLMPAGAGA